MFEHCLYFNTTSLARKLERAWAVAFKPFGLTPPQAFLLRVVLAQPGCLQVGLAQTMNITKPTASRTLDGLVKLGWVVRVGADGDARGMQVYPTAQALQTHDALNRASAEVTRRFKKRLGVEAFETVVSQVRAVGDALG